MTLTGSIVSFIIGLLIGGLAIYISASVVVDVRNYSYAVFTALVGAIVWAVTSLLFGWIPLVGPLIVLLAWIWVIKWRYPGGWIDAGIIGVIAWVSAIVVLFALSLAGIDTGIVGIPGT